MSTPDTTNTLPRKAYLRGKGRVRILEYGPTGKPNYFLVLTWRDERVMVHRDRLRFIL